MKRMKKTLALLIAALLIFFGTAFAGDVEEIGFRVDLMKEKIRTCDLEYERNSIRNQLLIREFQDYQNALKELLEREKKIKETKDIDPKK